MPAYNDKFEIDLDEMDLIEDALRHQVQTIAASASDNACREREQRLRAAKTLLGRLHNQKVFYRPKHGYIGG